MSDDDLIPAATVLVLRDSSEGLEVLMLRRNSEIAFGGIWVFPGGKVDPGDEAGSVLNSARQAAARELAEETSLSVSADELIDWSYWVPPMVPAIAQRGPRRRFSTWFFAVAAPPAFRDEVSVDGGEIHEHQWLTPRRAFELRAAGEIDLVPPTFVTLHQLNAHQSVEAALLWASATESEEFRTRGIKAKPLSVAWAGDACYENGPDGPMLAESDQPIAPIHRLVFHKDRDWEYLRSS